MVTLTDVPWELYLALSDLPENRRARLTYDATREGGLLEIEVPIGTVHETVLSLLRRLMEAWVEERRVPHRVAGQTTFQQIGLRGAEGDTAFYIQNFEAVRNREVIRLTNDPPPDVAVEVVDTNPLDNKEPVWAGLGVPELWVWRRGTLSVRVRTPDGAGYEPADASRALPGFPFSLAETLIDRRTGADHGTLVREFRDAVRMTNDE